VVERSGHGACLYLNRKEEARTGQAVKVCSLPVVVPWMIRRRDPVQPIRASVPGDRALILFG
jgi:hypothetical protein